MIYEDITFDENGNPIFKGELVNVYDGSVARGNKAVRARWLVEMKLEQQRLKREQEDIYEDENGAVPGEGVSDPGLG